ncbi:MAG: sigma-70 family RNA polymerase sigma factor [Anaerolineae bacterium]|nr:sigma-70 family RNA polymerase sigma factor [Anaerolineae bacterium]
MQALMLRIQQRDPTALSDLYDLFSSKVYSLTAMILGEDMAAQEVTQDVFMKVWDRPESYRDEQGKFASWLLTVARRSAIDRLRRENRQFLIAASLDDDEFPQLRDFAEDDETRWRELRLLMDELPPDQRETLVLSFYRGLSQSDISAYLNVPLGTIKTRMKLAMDKLRVAWRRG